MAVDDYQFRWACLLWHEYYEGWKNAIEQTAPVFRPCGRRGQAIVFSEPTGIRLRFEHSHPTDQFLLLFAGPLPAFTRQRRGVWLQVLLLAETRMLRDGYRPQ